MKYLFYIAICAGNICIQAQSYQLSFQHINSNNQLPEAEISCLYEHHGLLYIGTEAGLFAFNGGTVFNIPLEPSGDKVNITSMMSDSLGNLWIGSYDGLYIYNKKEKTTAIHSYAGRELNYVETIHCDENGNIWLLSSADNNAIVSYNIFSSQLNYFGNNYNSIRSFRKENGKMKELWFTETKGAYKIIFEKEKPVVKRYLDGGDNTEVSHVNDIYVDIEGTALLSTQKGLKLVSSFDLQKDEEVLQNVYPGNVNSTIIYRNVLFISTSTEGLIVFDMPHQKVVARYKEKSKDEGSASSNSIKFSRVFNHCLYVVTTNNTIDYCGLSDNEFSLIRPSLVNDGFKDIAIHRDKIWLVGNDSAIYEMNGNEFTPSTEIKGPAQRIQTLGRSVYTMNGRTLKEYGPEKTTTYFFENSYVTNIYGVQKNGDSIFVNTNSGIFQLADGRADRIKGLQDEVYLWYEHLLPLNETTLLVNAYYSYFLVLKKHGPQYIKEKLIQHIDKVNQVWVFKDRISPDKIVIIDDEGICLLDTIRDTVIPIKASQGNKQYRMVSEGLASLVVVTDKSVETCYFSGDSLKTFKSHTNIPLETIENNDVVVKERKLYIPTKKGVLVYDEQKQQSGTYQLNINNIHISNETYKTTLNDDTIKTRFSKSEISMDVGLWSSHIHHQTSIKYFLSKEDAGLVTEGRKSKIYFERISPGTHILTIQALDKEGKKLAEEKIIIIVQKEWYQSTWFYMILGFVILSMSYVLFRWRLKVENKKTQKQETMLRKIKESENLALRSQMNPHFIFNTLNSINTYIVNEDTENASSYLNMFSKLIRNTLDLTRSEKVTLEQELTTLKLYMDIEKSRTNFKFDYQIRIDKNVDPDFIKIPPLIIQPFVENSIWHGIQGMEGRGLIEIGIDEQTDHLITIHITDNGIGRKEAKLKERASHGLNITKERLSIWNEKSYFEIIDLVNEKNQSTGTKAIIYLYY